MPRIALIKPPRGGGIRIEAYRLYKPLASVPERRAQPAANSIESVVSIERLFEKHSF